jgi:hypothetical protein
MDQPQTEPVMGELLSTPEGEPVKHYESGGPRLTAGSGSRPELVHDAIVLKWFVGSPAGSVEGMALVRWLDDGTYHVANIGDLLYRES